MADKAILKLAYGLDKYINQINGLLNLLLKYTFDK
jgi:hypothetical protein